jgi:hypothetical protein
MKPAFSALALLALLLACETVCAGDYVVEVSGTEGTPFGGVCLMITGDNHATRVVAGAAPRAFDLSGDIVSCAIQRKAGQGHLHVLIRNTDGRVVDESPGMLPFGVFTAAGR